MPNGLKIDGCHMFHFKHLHLRFSTESPGLKITNKFSGLKIIGRMKIAGKCQSSFQDVLAKSATPKYFKKLQWIVG